MKKILIPIIAVSALAATTVPALAQGYGYGYGSGRAPAYGDNNWGPDDRGRDNWGQNNWQNINQRQMLLDRRIEQGLRNGALSRSEALRLRAEFHQIARLEANYRRNGLTQWERSDLDRRFDRLSAQIRFERRDRDYGYGYGYGDGRR